MIQAQAPVQQWPALFRVRFETVQNDIDGGENGFRRESPSLPPMPLKLTIPDLSDLPEALRSLYKQRGDGGGFILDVEGGAVAKTQLDEFRQKNIDLQKKLTALGDMSPDDVAGLRLKVTELEEQLQGASKGKDKDFETRLTPIRTALEKQIQEAKSQAENFKKRLETVVIDKEIARHAAEVGALPTALDDVAFRLRAKFRVDDQGNPYAADEQGNKIYGDDGKVLDIGSAVRGLTKQAPHLFKQSSGGGASGGAAGGQRTNTGANPWAKATRNITEQMRITQADPQAAARLQAEAGVS